MEVGHDVLLVEGDQASIRVRDLVSGGRDLLHRVAKFAVRDLVERAAGPRGDKRPDDPIGLLPPFLWRKSGEVKDLLRDLRRPEAENRLHESQRRVSGVRQSCRRQPRVGRDAYADVER